MKSVIPVVLNGGFSPKTGSPFLPQARLPPFPLFVLSEPAPPSPSPHGYLVKNAFPFS